MQQTAIASALEFYIDSGVTDFCDVTPTDLCTWSEQKPLPTKNVHKQALDTSPLVEGESSTNQAALGKSEILSKVTEELKAISTLESLKDYISKFDGLAIQKTALNTVFSEGNENATLMIISDVPGESEDRTGQPFAGINRQILLSALNGLSLSIDDIYTASLFNWRPPGNRSPQDIELATCTLLLNKHIELLKPKLILSLGNVTCKALLDCKTNINKLRGNWQNFIIQGMETPVPLMPSFHPASIVKNAKQKRLLWQDLLAVNEKMRSIS